MNLRRLGRGGAKASLAFSISIAALPLLPLDALASAGPPDVTGYGVRLLIGAALLGALLLALSRFSRTSWFRRRFPLSNRCRLLGTLPLGREVLYLVRLGPEVVALVCGRGGTSVVGRWDRSRWEEEKDDVL